MVKKVYNLTMYRQGEKAQLVARNAGYELQETPLAPIVEPGQVGLEEAADEIVKTLRRAASLGMAVLIGGHTGALVYALREIKDEPWPEMIVFETRRIRDENDQYILEPIGVVTIPES